MMNCGVESVLNKVIIFYCRSECQKQINGFKQPQYKKFSTKEEAEEFIAKKKDGTVDNRKKVSSTSKDEENGTKKDKSSSEGKCSFSNNNGNNNLILNPIILAYILCQINILILFK